MAGRPVVYDPVAETEYLVEADLQAAEEDAVLGPLASTYEPNSDRRRSARAPPALAC